MIGWKPNPFIFVNIPKFAGTSIETSLLPTITGRASFKALAEGERFRFWLPGRKGLQHPKIRRYARRFQMYQYYWFAFVRNPWDRATSKVGYLRFESGIIANTTMTHRPQDRPLFHNDVDCFGYQFERVQMNMS